MSTTKRILGDYNITSIDAVSNVVITTNTVKVNGNLDVIGNITYVESSQLSVTDPFITVAGNNSGTLGTAPFQSQGVVAQASGNRWAGIRFNNSSLKWEVSSQVNSDGSPITAYQAIGLASAGAVGAPANSIQYNDGAGAFAGSSNLLFDPVTSTISLNGSLALANIATTPTSIANTAILYNKANNSGTTGVFVKSSTVDDELISATQAKKFAIIF